MFAKMSTPNPKSPTLNPRPLKSKPGSFNPELFIKSKNNEKASDGVQKTRLTENENMITKMSTQTLNLQPRTLDLKI